MRSLLPVADSNESSGFQLPAPVGGWNTRDPLANMPSLDAVFLDNFFPCAGGVMVRKGYEQFAEVPQVPPPTAPRLIKSLLSYTPSSGTKALFAADQTGIYNVTAGGSATTPSSAATDGAWQWVNISTAGGAFLWCCNGTDEARYWNGAAWTLLNGTSTPALTGITSTAIINVALHQSRMFLVEEGKLSFHYLPVNSIAGAAAEFPLGAIFRRGGYTMAIGSWTVDAGTGMDDHFCIITSEGEVAVYKGIDPSNAATWSLVGVYFCGRPLGRRCLTKLGGDLLILTVDGVIPLSRLLQSSVIDRRSFITDKINTFFTTMVENFGDAYGWCFQAFPEAQMLLINVPLGRQLSWQFVMNTTTGAWCRFVDWNAEAWCYHDGGIYFAVRENVRKAWEGHQDGNAAITARAKTAFQYVGGRGRIKRITLLRPIFTASAALKASLALDTDFRAGRSNTQSTSFAQNISFWDQALWDQAYWSNDLTVAQWRTVAHAPGKAFSLRMRLSLKNVAVTWSVTDFIATSGGLM